MGNIFENNMSVLLHEVECFCQNPIDNDKMYKVPVLSKIDLKTGQIEEKIIQCDNCKRLLSIKEINETPEILQSGLFRTKKDISLKFSPDLISVLEKYGCSTAIYEFIEYLFENSFEGKIILDKNVSADTSEIEYVVMYVRENGKYEIFSGASSNMLKV